MKMTNRLLTLSVVVVATACGNNGSGDDEVATTAITQDGGTSNADAEAGESAAESSQGESAGESAGETAGTADTSGNDTSTTATTNTTNADGNDGQTKFDLGGIPDSAMNCQDFGGDGQFSYLWAANSSQGTISKLDTQTVTEVGRYIVRPDSAGSPSRTSVSLSGNVAVANRSGGVAKIYARVEDCEDTNGQPGIQTSNNNQALPWGTEECIAWYTPFGYASQRPVAWGLGEFNQGTCNYENEELWTSGNNQNGHIDILVLDGDDGTTTEMIQVPTGGNSLVGDFYGIYGGAVDGDGNFWGSQLGSSGKLIKVVRADMSYTVYDPPDGPHYYGMTVDSEGFVWLCSGTAARFDPMTETWTSNQVGGYTGCMADAGENGLLWMSNGSGVVGVNRDTLAVEKTCPGNGSYGVSIDFEGYVWAVASGSLATKWDPATCQSWSYNGLVGAYTYSDMTGYALSNAGTPSG